MMRGTTPEHTFTLSVDTGSLRNVRVIYVQGDKRIVAKEGNACILSGNTVKVKLTQEETFLFDHKKMVEIQVRALTKSGDALNSEIVTETVERCLDTEVIR
jgi:hypothetical protein